MSKFDIPINLTRLRQYHPHADALAKLEEKRDSDLISYQFTVVTKYSTKEDTEALIDKIIDLLTKYGCEEEYFALDLLFFSTFIYNDIPRLDSQYKDIATAKTTLKSLIDILRIEKENKLSDIKIEIKGNVGDKAVITSSGIISDLLPVIIETLKGVIYSSNYNSQLAQLLNNVEPNYDALNEVYENLKLTKKRPYSQAIGYNANLILNYLDHETKLTKGEAQIISDRQCQFIYDYLCLFEFLDDEDISSLPKDYIRSMIENFDLSSL